MTEVVIVDGVRTAIGKYGGGLSSVRPDDLLACTYKALAARTGVDPAELDEVFADPQVIARGMRVDLGGMPGVRSPFTFSDAQLALDHPSPMLGEHTPKAGN